MADKKRINTKDLVGQIEKLTKERISKENLVSLEEFRQTRPQKDPQTLLLIEDDETMREAIKRIFETDGYRVISAADGTQLSSVLDDTPIDVIILDIGLPWINGFELAKLMKEHRDLRLIPLVFVSGRTSETDVKRAFEVGADDFIKKPFDIMDLKKAVNTLAELRS